MTDDWFEEAWAIREEEVYPKLLGSIGEGIFTLSHDLFLKTFQQDSFDPRWLNYGVFECPPVGDRASWLYVSSGLSNAWEADAPDPAGPSGLGMEFLLVTPERAQWAIVRLQHVIAFQILIACGRYPSRGLLDLHDRIPLRSSISPQPSALTWLFVGPPDGYAQSFALPTGSVDFMAAVGVTDDEAAHARSLGGAVLVDLLRTHAQYPLTDPARRSVLGAA